MSYTLAIDTGIASVGFSGVKEKDILFLGSHLFDAAEVSKTRASLAEPRRKARGQRRTIQRRGQRKKAIRRLLQEHDITIFSIDLAEKISVWQLREEALNRLLTDAEFAKVLFHIAKRRGYQSNRKDSSEDNATKKKKILTAINSAREAMKAEGFRTAGQYLASFDKQRNGDYVYDKTIDRDMLREEVQIIFEQQRECRNNKATKKLQEEYTKIAFTQRPLKSFANMVGDCIFYPEEKRAAKNAPSAELFVMWTKLNNLKIISRDAKERQLNQDEKIKIASLARKNKGGVTYKAIRKELKIANDSRFNFSYRKTKDTQTSWEDIRKACENTIFMCLKGYQALKVALHNGSDIDWNNLFANERNKLDEAARILSFINDEKEIKLELEAIGFTKDEIDSLLKITNFNKTVDLSLKAINQILPFMQEGKIYNEACEEAGIDFKAQNKNEKESLLPPFPNLRNPVVNRSLAQVRKVINACIRKYGMPDKIIVELARAVGKSKKQRDEIDTNNKKNETNRAKAKEHMQKILGSEPRGGDILKYRLWKEQDEFCPYSGEYIKRAKLADDTAVQIDHILPYSRTYNDSYMNKVLCMADENQKKGNKTPYEYLGANEQTWQAIEKFTDRLPKNKADNILQKELSRETEAGFKDRNLNDTRYISRELKNHIEQHLDFGKNKEVKNIVQTRNGALTARLRAGWGFPDNKRVNDKHHALDAIILACSTQSMVQKFTSWSKLDKRGESHYPKPWKEFREDVTQALSNMFCSRMPVYKMTGPAHQETIRSIREDKDGERQIVQRIKLASISKSNLDDIVDKERNYQLYNVLKERLEQHDWDTKKAFAKPIYMPTKNPEKQGPQIYGIRIYTNYKSGVEINGGLVSNGNMLRTDVFRKKVKDKWKYYLCPVYVHHMVEDKLPNRLIKAATPVKAATPEEKWPEIDDNYEFIFSLHKNDLVRIQSKKDDYFGYFISTNRSTASITVCGHDKDPSFGKKGKQHGIGVQNLLVFEKYSVNVFGEKTQIKSEVRCELANNFNTEPSED